ncbi:hypothetical protein QBC35DRAFT_148776 [Podospora australis]|uniref:Ysc84 actin-binding domain-containing protein n=1 Tax=Podospora australis TaxID=1536484 RepID=A0AAN6WW45_9PEZI|nr:hypothetical protein QBC35DRAFT_148776 [Podospora australis]
MQRVSAFLPSWDRSRHSNTRHASVSSASTTTTQHSAPGAFGKVFGWAEKIVVPVNRLSTASLANRSLTPTRFDRETYWPTNLDKECDKAARILKSFCFDGFQYPETRQPGEETTTPETPSEPSYVTKKIPSRIIQNAVGLAVFSCMRSGLWMSGSGGAGLITARKADGTWSPPSGIILHTAELGFVIGVDVYDCVLVINNVQTLELFTRPRLTLGVDCSLSVGPLVAMEGPEPEIKWKEISDTVLTYIKARGKHQAVGLDGSLVTERGNENERFYDSNVSVMDILAGNIPKTIPEMRPLFEVIKAAEGRTDYDKPLFDWLAQQPAPGDAVIETPKMSMSPATPSKLGFGIPDVDDPDPYGVIGLEMAGIEIREAGSKLRPTSTQFEYHPSPTSPVFARFSRQSMETFASRSNRGSTMSAKTQATAMTDAYTQTDVTSQAETSFSRANSDDGKDSVSDKLPAVVEPEEVDYTKVDMSIIERLRKRASEVPPGAEISLMEVIQEAKEEKAAEEAKATPAVEEKPVTVDRVAGPDASTEPVEKTADERDEDADDEDEEEEAEEDVVICEVATAAAQPTRSSIRTSQITQVIQAKGAHVVTIPKRIPPPLPARSPARASRGSKSEYGDVSSLKSPVRNSVLSIESPASESDHATEVSMDDALSRRSVEQRPESPMMYSRPESPRHQKNSSSVSTAVAVQTILEQRKSLEQNPMPQSLETPSSAEDSEREPRTPQTENEFLSAAEQQDEKMVTGAKEVRIVSPTGSTESRSVSVV